MRKVHTRPNLLFEYIQPKNTARHTSKAIDPAAPSSSPRPTRTSASSSSSPQIPTPFQRAADDPVDVPDVPRVWDALREPFMWQVRELGEGKGVKILWWEVVRGAVRVLADTLGCGVGVCVREWKGVCG
ncbi:hypothetical protein HBI53_082380 [Parastagonospora nodorum]|nr:hypothetical protein HBI53_082380 [Parastagonospora nodorum]